MLGARGGSGSDPGHVHLSRALALLWKCSSGVGLVLAGGVGSGKTRAGEALANELLRRGISVGGVLCPRILGRGETVGYLARDVGTGTERPFARLAPPGTPVGRFFVSDGALAFAGAAVERGAREARVVVVDEVGRWELEGGGLAHAVRTLLASPAVAILLVRDTLVSEAADEFACEHFEVLSVGGTP